MRRYWLQGDYEGFDVKKGFKVYLKTDDLSKAINLMKYLKYDVFISDCIARIVVDANYDCKIVGI